ncbi:MAG: hypothetical protein WCA21_16770 [Terracidiphilus sp.]
MMRRLSAIQLSAVFLLISAIAPVMAAQAQTVQSPTTGQTLRQRQGFFDYALGKINPSNTDYGAEMADGRSALVGHTIDDLYFWSNAVTLCLLVCAAGIIYFEWRSAAKKEIVAATIIAELWNGRVSDRIEIVRRTEQFNQLVEVHNQETERLLSAPPKASEQEQEIVVSITKNASPNGYSGSPATVSAAKSTSQTPRATESAAVGNANDGAARLQQSNLLLQRRVEALENSENNLKQRLNQTTLLLDEERRRNATLKGA